MFLRFLNFYVHFLIIFANQTSFFAANNLSEYISYYEPLSYDTKAVHSAHLRSKRSLISNNNVYLSFSAHQRHFRLRLKRDLEVFSDKLEVLDDKGQRIDMDTAHVYSGHILGKFGAVGEISLICQASYSRSVFEDPCKFHLEETGRGAKELVSYYNNYVGQLRNFGSKMKLFKTVSVMSH